MKKTAAFASMTLALCLAGCGAGQYSFSKSYEPLDPEEDLWETSKAYTYDAVNTEPEDYQDKVIGWFGVVKEVTEEPDGRQRIKLSHRKHKERHLCNSDSDSSCRVTVHFKSSGDFSVLLKLNAEDMKPGLDKVQPGTLLRVYGKVRCQENDDEEMVCDYDDHGGILMEGIYYRQWPARHFVTTRAAASMKR